MIVVCTGQLYYESQERKQALAAFLVGDDNLNCFEKVLAGLGGTVRSHSMKD